ncbi:MAG: hypothetical protein P8P83_02765 [Rickettsiaceae bacterium]|nr:hypothetical protein [Rickettsiaceae bacterium]
MHRTAWTSNDSSHQIRPAKMQRISSAEDNSSTSYSSGADAFIGEFTTPPLSQPKQIFSNSGNTRYKFLSYEDYSRSLHNDEELLIDHITREEGLTYNSPREQAIAEANGKALRILESACSENKNNSQGRSLSTTTESDYDNRWDNFKDEALHQTPHSYNQFRPTAITTQPGSYNEWDEGSLYSGTETSSSYAEYDVNPAGENPAEEIFAMDDV